MGIRYFTKAFRVFLLTSLKKYMFLKLGNFNITTKENYNNLFLATHDSENYSLS